MRSLTYRSAKTIIVTILFVMVSIQNGLAHHGWGWATDEEFEITGRITDVSLGNPHGEVTLMVDDEKWVAEVGQPWRNERAGLSEEQLQIGRIITVHGHRSSKSGEKLIKAERVVVGGVDYILYPDRDS